MFLLEDSIEDKLKRGRAAVALFKNDFEAWRAQPPAALRLLREDKRWYEENGERMEVESRAEKLRVSQEMLRADPQPLSLRFGWDGFLGTETPIYHYGDFKFMSRTYSDTLTRYTLHQLFREDSSRSQNLLIKASKKDRGWMAVTGLDRFDSNLPKVELICNGFSARRIHEGKLEIIFGFTSSKLDDLRR